MCIRDRYKVESLGWGKYRVTSSPYSTDVVDKDNKTKKENISFDTTTDMAGMLLILANKNLVPYTDKEYQEYKNTSHTDTNLVPQKERKRYTFNVWKSVLQGKFKDVVGAIKKKIWPEEEDELLSLIHI